MKNIIFLSLFVAFCSANSMATSNDRKGNGTCCNTQGLNGCTQACCEVTCDTGETGACKCAKLIQTNGAMVHFIQGLNVTPAAQSGGPVSCSGR